MVQDSIVDQRSKDDDNKVPWWSKLLRRNGQRKSRHQGIGYTHKLPWPWVYTAIFRTCVGDPLAPIHIDGQLASSLQV